MLPGEAALSNEQPVLHRSPWYKKPNEDMLEQAILQILATHQHHPEGAVDWAERVVDRTVNKAIGILTFNAFLLVIAVLILSDKWSWTTSVGSALSIVALASSALLLFRMLTVSWGD